MQRAAANREMEVSGTDLENILSTQADIGIPGNQARYETLEIMKSRKERNAVVIPSTYEDAVDSRTGAIKDPLRNFLDVLNALNNLTRDNVEVILGLDTADTRDKYFNVVRQTMDVANLEVQHNTSPEMMKKREMFEKMNGVALENGKGTNLHLMFQNLHSRGHDYNVMVADADILAQYLRIREVVNMFAGMVHPVLGGDFVKAYYTRITGDGQGGMKLAGRVMRLLMDPLIDAMMRNFSSVSPLVATYLEYFKMFPYKLSGEIGISSRKHGKSGKNFSDMPLLKGWPLEVGTIDYQFRNSLEAPLFRGEPQYAVRHVKWEGFDHDHGDRHKMKRMARGIIRSRFEALYELDVMDVFKPGRIVKLVNDYRKIASDYVVRYSSLSRAQGLSYDVNKEKRSVDDFANQIWKGYTDFLNQPRSNSLIPPVSEAPMDFRARETERKVPLQPEILIDPAVNQPMSAMHAYA